VDQLGQLCHTPKHGYASVATVRRECPAACGACADGIGQIEVLSSSQDGVEISVLTPSWRLGVGVTQQTVKARVEHSLRPDIRLEFQYVYEEAVPSIVSAAPRFGFDSDSTEVSVTIMYFPYPSGGVRVTFGDFLLSDMDVTVWPSSNREKTQISFTTPGGTAHGQYDVKITPKSCPNSCPSDDAAWVESKSETRPNNQGGQTTTTWTTKCAWVASNLDNLGQLCRTPMCIRWFGSARRQRLATEYPNHYSHRWEEPGSALNGDGCRLQLPARCAGGPGLCPCRNDVDKSNIGEH